MNCIFSVRLESRRRKIIRLPYSVPYDVPEGTEYRISLVVEGGKVKVTVLVILVLQRIIVNFLIIAEGKVVKSRQIISRWANMITLPRIVMVFHC
jgi:hypothetical protein